MGQQSSSSAKIRNQSNEELSKNPNEFTERIFKYSSFTCLFFVIVCFPGFLRFRQFCKTKGYYVFSTDGFYYTALGFIIVFITRYGYYHIARESINKLVKPKYQGYQRQRKIDNLLKLTFDFFFYICATTFFYTHFGNQYWVTEAVGGKGRCDLIYRDYPDWPPEKRPSLEKYFCFQLGVHIFSLFELFVIRKQKERKYFEWMLHHMLASALILFSMMCNEIIVGTMILGVHDLSDIFLSGTRFYSEAKLPIYLKNMFFDVIALIILFCSWIYFRLMVYPYCLLTQVYNFIPKATDQWYIIKGQYIFLLVMCWTLVVMHAYWLTYIIRAFIAYIGKKETLNHFDIQKKQ